MATSQSHSFWSQVYDGLQRQFKGDIGDVWGIWTLNPGPQKTYVGNMGYRAPWRGDVGVMLGPCRASG